jgi:hypothetical protein
MLCGTSSVCWLQFNSTAALEEISCSVLCTVEYAGIFVLATACVLTGWCDSSDACSAW